MNLSEADVKTCKQQLTSLVTALLSLAKDDPLPYKFVVNRCEAHKGVEGFVDEIFNRLLEARSSSCEYRLNNADLKIHLRIDSHACIRGNVTYEYESSEKAWGSVYDLLVDSGLFE